jgi:hypothetical protein
MAQANLVSIIAKFSSHLITLRDDHTRLGNLIMGDSLTTVMGPAANAGVKDVTLIVATLRANTVLQAMTAHSGNQEQLFAWTADSIKINTMDAGRAAVERATAEAKDKCVEQLKTLNARNETTLVALEAAVKMLLSGAEAKANIITRKREEAEARFVTSIELVKHKIALITTQRSSDPRKHAGR